MKRISLGISLFLIVMFVKNVFAIPMIICDFSFDDNITNIYTKYGKWERYPEDETQGIVLRKITDKQERKVLQIDYDVDSPNQSYNGLWFKLDNFDFSGYKKMLIDIEKSDFCTDKFKIELKAFGQIVKKKYIKINMDKEIIEISFSGIPRSRLRNLNELTFVFADDICNPKKGTIYIKSISVV